MLFMAKKGGGDKERRHEHYALRPTKWRGYKITLLLENVSYHYRENGDALVEEEMREVMISGRWKILIQHLII